MVVLGPADALFMAMLLQDEYVGETAEHKLRRFELDMKARINDPDIQLCHGGCGLPICALNPPASDRPEEEYCRGCQDKMESGIDV